jgi:transposase-like protein
MAARKRHSDAEITAKLSQAELLAKGGSTQSDIARVLGVSIMTFHRWRKAHPPRGAVVAASMPTAEPEAAPDQRERVAELQLENLRLRQLVTDLLLEKIKLEEARNQSPK